MTESAKRALATLAGGFGTVLLVAAAAGGGLRYTIAPYGGHGGGSFEALCPAGSYLVGLDVSSEKRVVAGIRLQCGASEGKAFGHLGEAPEILRCPAGQVAVGIWGGSGAYVDRLSLTCSPETDPLGPTQSLEPVGGTGGSGFRVRCEDGALRGLRGRAGALIDAVEAICAVDDVG
jgi:hypothetical protein